MIDGATTRLLQPNCTENGRILEFLQKKNNPSPSIAQANFTVTYPAVVDAWHYHPKCIEHFACLNGMIKFVMFDGRKASKTFGELTELFIGKHNLQLLTIPPGIYHGWRCISTEEACSINLYSDFQPDTCHLPKDSDFIPYLW